LHLFIHWQDFYSFSTIIEYFGGRKIMKRALTLGIVLVLLLACVGTVSANLVQNGEFESPIAASPWSTLFPGNGLTGWTIETGSIDLINGYWQPHAGAQSVDLAGNSPARISQTITTVPGASYDLSFWIAGNPDMQGQKVLGVYWDGAELSPAITFDSSGKTHQNMGWELVTISGLTATKTTTEIAFEHKAPEGPCGVALDDISVDPTGVIPAPEFPGIALPALMLVGFMGVVLFVQKSREN
jgi:choice-of-anchor C domain-containing protein